MIEPAPSAEPTGQRDAIGAEHPADGRPVHPQVLPAAVVGLHERADDVAAVGVGEHARRRADAALEAVADHAGPAADRPFGDAARTRVGERLAEMIAGHVLAVDVVQQAVPGLADDRQRPGLARHRARAARPRTARRARPRRCACS